MGVHIADHWFELRRIDDDITLLWEPHVVPLMRCNVWHVRGRDRDLFIDTGMGICSLREAAKSLLDKPVTAVATHVHADHIGNHHEFDECLAHPAEIEGLRNPSGDFTLVDDSFDGNDLATLLIPKLAGYDISGPLLTALPYAGYDLRGFRIKPARHVLPIGEGAMVDTGDRAFEVLHLPGHSPGGIGLWEASTGTLFSGDALYDGPLIDGLHHSNIADYVRTLRRLRELPVRTVHAGHDPSFGRERLCELVDGYLAQPRGKLNGN